MPVRIWLKLFRFENLRIFKFAKFWERVLKIARAMLFHSAAAHRAAVRWGTRSERGQVCE